MPKTDRALSPAEIERLETEISEAILASDVAALDRLIEEDLVFVNHLGHRVTKAEDLALHRSGRLRFDALERQDTEIRVYGSCAVALSRCSIDGTMDGQRFRETMTFLRSWAATNAGPKVVALAVHASPG